MVNTVEMETLMELLIAIWTDALAGGPVGLFFTAMLGGLIAIICIGKWLDVRESNRVWRKIREQAGVNCPDCGGRIALAHAEDVCPHCGSLPCVETLWPVDDRDLDLAIAAEAVTYQRP